MGVLFGAALTDEEGLGAALLVLLGAVLTGGFGGVILTGVGRGKSIFAVSAFGFSPAGPGFGSALGAGLAAAEAFLEL
ncbi:hypothetical protein [Nonomuraea sp. bgisy101]|uniref:hypothetical protein n=1 Tax=Nonomuraea sp. bgisy101 TaxID=3413784 RepID=UPI003D74B236